MIRTRTILAFILVALGLVWIGQGTGLLKGTGFMVGDTRWAVDRRRRASSPGSPSAGSSSGAAAEA